MLALSLVWLRGLLSRRLGRLIGAILGVAMTVALLATLLGFIGEAERSMTARAVAGVPVDWQLQINTGIDRQSITDAVQHATSTSVVASALYADFDSLTASGDGTVQTTGAGKVLGLSPGYDKALPGQIRLLLGTLTGPLLAQQTAANLHATVGSTVTITRPGLSETDLTIAGIVDLPNQDSMFQAVGLPPGAAPQAPPDNVLILSEAQWHRLFDSQAAVRPDSIKTQLHVRLERADLPHDPAAAYSDVLGRARNLEARIAGTGVIADNLATRLDAVRADALYARVLFLFLGAPGVAVAILLTLTVATAGGERRRREQALLRVRGAGPWHLAVLAAIEASVIGIGGSALGLLVAGVAARAGGPSGMAMAAGADLVAATAGIVLALVAVLLPAVVSARRLTVATARADLGPDRQPLWQRLWIDFVLLAASAAVFWLSAASSYQVVLAPEGVAQTAVDYTALLAPVCLWLGGGLVTMRLLGFCLGRSRYVLANRLVVLGGRLAPLVASALARRRRALARSAALAALAVGFAVSTSVFNTTYNAQSRVDARLTNGADVTVTGSTAHPAGGLGGELGALPGVAAAEPMLHRFAYVGADLQDIYGIDPRTIDRATSLANAFFGNGNAKASLAALAARRDGVLVSQETVTDFQLQPGDTLNLRLQGKTDHQYHVVPFRFVGVAREFPTAPHDSFLVANADYLAEVTGEPGAEILLLRTNGNSELVASAARKLVADVPGAKVTSIGETQQLISSTLTAVDLGGLTRLELAFAILAVAGVAGLLFGLGIAERRRGFAILALIGARGREISGFLWSEAFVVTGAGLVFGGLIGLLVAGVLVTELQGVFDPPPETLTLPWLYLTTLVVCAIASAGAVVVVASRLLCIQNIEALREMS